jgi:hypothetical protein
MPLSNPFLEKQKSKSPSAHSYQTLGRYSPTNTLLLNDIEPQDNPVFSIDRFNKTFVNTEYESESSSSLIIETQRKQPFVNSLAQHYIPKNFSFRPFRL